MAPLRPPVDEVWLTPTQVQAAGIRATPADEHELDDALIVGARIAFDDQRLAHVFSPLAGRITEVFASLGQHVKKGDVLAVIASPELGEAVAQALKANADAELARRDFVRKGELLDAGACSRAEYELSADTLARADAERDRAQLRLSLLGVGEGSATQRFELRSPIEGEVVARAVAPGAEVVGLAGGATSDLFTVGRVDRVWVLAQVQEMDAGRVRIGTHVRVTLHAYPERSFDGTVDLVGAALDPATRTLTVRATVENGLGLLKPEMYATAELAVSPRRALAVPRTAVARIGDHSFVFVDLGAGPAKTERFERRPVEVDEQASGPWVPVARGVEQGAEVVDSGALLLTSML